MCFGVQARLIEKGWLWWTSLPFWLTSLVGKTWPGGGERGEFQYKIIKSSRLIFMWAASMNVDSYTLKEHLVRSYDVMVLGVAYLVFGLASSYVINRFSSAASAGDSRTKLILEISIEVAVTILFSYFIHVIIERMPLPMAGTPEMRQQIIKQVRGGIVIAFAMFTLQIKLRNKIQYLFYGKVEDYQLVDLSG